MLKACELCSQRSQLQKGGGPTQVGRYSPLLKGIDTLASFLYQPMFTPPLFLRCPSVAVADCASDTISLGCSFSGLRLSPIQDVSQKSLHSGKLELSHAAGAPKGLKKLIRRSCTQHVRGDIGRGHAAQVLWLFQGGVAGRVACKIEDGPWPEDKRCRKVQASVACLSRSMS